MAKKTSAKVKAKTATKLSEIDKLMLARGYVRTADVAKMCKRDIATVQRWVTSKRVVSMRYGRKVYIEYESLVKMLGPMAEMLGLPRRPVSPSA